MSAERTHNHRKRSHTISVSAQEPKMDDYSRTSPITSQPRAINIYRRLSGNYRDIEAQVSPGTSSPTRTRFFDNPFNRRRLRQQSLNFDDGIGLPPVNPEPPAEVLCTARSLPSPRLLNERGIGRSISVGSDANGGRHSSGLVLFVNTDNQRGPEPPSPNGSQSGTKSPRRPLFVDTQLANATPGPDRKKSPVSAVVDYVRARRTNSISNPSPSPGTVKNVFNNDPNSPLSRSSINRILRSASSSGYKSVEGGESELSSPPSISTCALLIKEPSLMDAFDNLTVGGAFDSSAIFFESQEAVYSMFMRAHRCYDIVPVSAKLIVFDTRLPVRKAFFALLYNNVRAAPLYDSKSLRYLGMLTITDFIRILAKYYSKGGDCLTALEDEEIEHWRQKLAKEDTPQKQLVTVDPDDSLFRAVEILCTEKVHRLPVLETDNGNIMHILTHKRIMKHLFMYIHDLPRPSFMDKTPKELGIGSWGNILTIHSDTHLIDALKIFLESRVSALPIVDDDGKVVDIYAKFDVISLAAEKAYNNLDVNVSDALKYRTDSFEGVRTCLETDTLFQVVENIVRAEVHRLIVTDTAKRVVGVISLSDILKYLVLDTAKIKTDVLDIIEQGSPAVFESVEEEAAE